MALSCYFRVHTGKKGTDIVNRMIIRMLLFLSLFYPLLFFLKNLPNVMEVKAIQDHWKTKKMRTTKGEPPGYPCPDP